MNFNVNQVVLDAFTQHDFVFTMFASGTVTTDDIGKVVSLDTTADGTVKLAAADEEIYGRIYQVEDRSQEGVTTVSVETRFRKRVKIASGEVIARGDTVIGAAAGEVKAALTANPAANIVLAVDGDYAIVEK